MVSWTSPASWSSISMPASWSSTMMSLASRRLTANATRCCCAPSCRLRSTRRRSASPLATTLARDSTQLVCLLADLVQRRLEGGVELGVVQGQPDLACKVRQHPVIVL